MNIVDMFLPKNITKKEVFVVNQEKNVNIVLGRIKILNKCNYLPIFTVFNICKINYYWVFYYEKENR